MRTKGYNQNINVNNLNISYDDLGEGEIPIIFLHGFPFDKTMWRSQIDFIKASNRVIAVDIRGFGLSKDEETALSIGLFADGPYKIYERIKYRQSDDLRIIYGWVYSIECCTAIPKSI